MKRKSILVLLLISIVLLINLFISSFVTYAEPINSNEMQNIYISKIIYNGLPVLIINLIIAGISVIDMRTVNN